jgi:hypothetical protein
VDQSKREVRAALAAGLIGRQARAVETDEQRKGRMAAALMVVADASVSTAAKCADPSKTAVALANAERAVALAEKLMPAQVAVGREYHLHIAVADESDAVDEADADESEHPQDPVQ